MSATPRYRLTGFVADQEVFFDLDRGELVVGSSPECDLRLKASGVSRRHARLTVRQGGLVVEDLGSKNGTLVDGERVQRAAVGAGAQLGFGTVQLAVESVDAGNDLAIRFETKSGQVSSVLAPQPTETVVATEEPGSRRSGRGERAPLPSLVFPEGYVRGRSAPMGAVYRRLASLVRGRRPILIQGETGVGKELLARAVHLSAGGAEESFLAVNCAAIPENLVESELFGIVQGAASGVEARAGYFVRAEGGTLFLDEIGELSPSVQAKLLRVLQDHEIQPVGGVPRSVDVRIVAATNVDPDSAPNDGRGLREDLFYRFAGGLLKVPPLRRCSEDVPKLISRMLERACQEEGVRLHGVTARALDALKVYSWPGNVRELEQVMWRLVTDRPASGVVDLDDLPRPIRQPEKPEEDEAQERLTDLRLKPRIEALQRRLAREAMIRTGGHIGNAAELLGMSRAGLTKMLDRLDLKDSWARPPEA